MKLLGNTKFAAAVAAVMLLLSALGGNVKSLNKLSDKVENSFYDSGKIDATDTIDAQLSVCADAILGIITVSSQYDALADETEALRRAREALVSAVTISEKETAFIAVGEAFWDLHNLVVSKSFVPEDIDDWNYYESLYHSAKLMLRELTTNYNDKVEDFPANIFGISPDRFEVAHWLV